MFYSLVSSLDKDPTNFPPLVGKVVEYILEKSRPTDDSDVYSASFIISESTGVAERDNNPG